MSFKFALGLWEHYKASLRVAVRPGPILIIHLTVLVLFLFLPINLWQMGVRSPLAYLAVLVTIVVYLPTIRLLSVVLRRSQRRGAYNDITIIVDDAGITQQTVLGTTHLPWSSLVAVQESAGLFLFYVTTNVAILLPVRVVKREGRLSDLRAMIVNNVAARASLAAG